MFRLQVSSGLAVQKKASPKTCTNADTARHNLTMRLVNSPYHSLSQEDAGGRVLYAECEEWDVDATTHKRQLLEEENWAHPSERLHETKVEEPQTKRRKLNNSRPKSRASSLSNSNN